MIHSSSTRINEANKAKYSNQKSLPMTGTRAMIGVYWNAAASTIYTRRDVVV